MVNNTTKNPLFGESGFLVVSRVRKRTGENRGILHSNNFCSFKNDLYYFCFTFNGVKF